jgi:hypothetical protein
MGVKDDLFRLASSGCKNGEQVSFWKDIWLGLAPLKYKYPNLYNIAYRKHVSGGSGV